MPSLRGTSRTILPGTIPLAELRNLPDALSSRAMGEQEASDGDAPEALGGIVKNVLVVWIPFTFMGSSDLRENHSYVSARRECHVHTYVEKLSLHQLCGTPPCQRCP